MQEGNEQARPDQQNEDGQRQCPPPAPSRPRAALVWPPCCITWTEFAHATKLISATDLSSTVVTRPETALEPHHSRRLRSANLGKASGRWPSSRGGTLGRHDSPTTPIGPRFQLRLPAARPA